MIIFDIASIAIGVFVVLFLSWQVWQTINGRDPFEEPLSDKWRPK